MRIDRKRYNILIIDQNEASRELLFSLLKKRDIKFFSFSNTESARDLLAREEIGLVISDHSGMEFLRRFYTDSLSIPLLYLGEKGEKKQQEAEKTLLRPFGIEEAEAAICSLLNREKEKVPIIIRSPQMKEVLYRVKKIAQSHASVFIVGESGTGKEVIANEIHNRSKRSMAPFIKVNCAALPDTLIESEFFGHEKGAFTGAYARRVGRFERANGGTLLLDEISEISASLQVKLLRVVQEQEVERLGGKDSIQVDVRLISTSNQDMGKALREKHFREDLYYRLNVIPLFLPPLRERKEDILPLAHFFLHQVCVRNQLALKKLSLQASKKLLKYSWPGNIRELCNVIEHSVIMAANEEIREKDIFFDLYLQPKEISLFSHLHTDKEMTLSALEKEYILHLFKKCERHQAKTAEKLGISVRTLRNKLKLYREQK